MVTVHQQRELRADLLAPHFGVACGTERDRQHVRVEVLELGPALAQLCHVLTAVQSAQVAQKDQQDAAPLPEGLVQ